MGFKLRPGTSVFGNVTFTPGTNENYVAPPIHQGPSIPQASYFLVGAPMNDNGGDNSGQVYVYNSIQGDDNSPDLIINAPAGYRSFFGHEIAENSTHIAIAAYGENSIRGAVYLYDKSDLTATPQRIQPSGLQQYDFFSVYALSMNETHLAVGNFGDDARGSGAGSGFIYNLDTMQYTELFPPTGSNTQFGFNCVLSDTHVVFTSAGNGSSSHHRSAFAWELSSSNSYSSTPDIEFRPSYYSTINGHTPSLTGGQGTIAISGNKLFIGDLGYDAPPEPTGHVNTDAGAVYMFDMDNPTADPVVFDHGASPRDTESGIMTRQLGWTVRVHDNKVYAGAPQGGANNTGLVYIWDIDNPSSPTKLEPTVGPGGMKFGSRISVAGGSLLVGAPDYSSASGQTGAAYLFDLNDLSQQEHLITYSGSGGEDRMGRDVLAVL